MSKKIIWQKNYERDTSFVLEGIWGQGLEKFIYERLKVKIKNKPLVLFYVDEENLQIWENEEAFIEYRDILLKENKKSSLFIDEIIREYKETLAKIEKIWREGATQDKNKIGDYIILVKRGMSLFSIWYYSLTNDKTPKIINDKLTELRNKDEFFAKNDMFIKSCLIELGVKKELANLVFSEEFPNIPSEQTLLQRKKGLVSIDGKENIIVNLKSFASENKNYIFEGLNVNTLGLKEVKGQIGNKGIVKGRVRIVKNYKQAEEVKPGEVIVSPMTTPDFLIAMKKAVAFVTNEGGIICHAGIMAREMNKPCVIGTKVATDVFKNGDLVEVDANKGTVKIISN
ncbi:MAG: PEP-utilizing enzyme [Nanoarchaeota archaeon]|nr:PEP-utilizing enzyme [Nanoarchaeota archaeon]